MSQRLKLIFAGTPDFAASHLQALLDSKQHDIIAVYSQPDRPAGRGKKLKPSPVKALALAHEIPVYQPLSLKDSDAQQQLAQLNADLMVVVAYGLLLPKAVLDSPRLGCINVHASLLPRWRGAAPIQRAIEAGDSETGVTIMQMDVGLDTGDMLLKATCPISEQDTGGSLHDKLIAVGQPALLSAVEQLANNSAQPEPQDDSLSNYASKMDKADMLIDWQLDAEQIARKIRAFNPFPVSYTTLNGERLKIWQASVIAGQDGEAGSLSSVNKKQLIVNCGSNSLSLDVIQLPGGKPLAIDALMNSKADLFYPGLVLGDS
ncbi:methionyl-tRNA formyltransferase [Dasania sp. GY-MA-18]|uniref:Methionyl-tRNA formyltransferase n=1 Tax=Dasania phycosphaerae TaxID=2950436 RepID=A0A9J6RP25_9GAMM|nr:MULTISPECIES: methionyl-tRNA formyltransferase [Dasania]MCR8923865.1 methionyl-tRNA formyltransferase [Dasania sp. GY-MA-18]MCZ0866299.1 methionyl-tRNA formyltransferase [Dasania phycosphaerae]MCZ0870023.1 methionyl-tRNA formyltransferase [Dasania phycosphaerae]